METGKRAKRTTKLVNFHADRDLVEAAQAKAREKGKTLTAVLTSALTAYTEGRWQPTDPQSTRLDGLEERVESLESELRQLKDAAGLH